MERLKAEFEKDAGSFTGDAPKPNAAVVGVSETPAPTHRRGAARIVYLSQDRIDLAFAAKALAMKMARPVKGDEAALNRCTKYLRSRPRGSYSYEWQSPPSRA